MELGQELYPGAWSVLSTLGQQECCKGPRGAGGTTLMFAFKTVSA